MIGHSEKTSLSILYGTNNNNNNNNRFVCGTILKLSIRNEIRSKEEIKNRAERHNHDILLMVTMVYVL